MAPSNGTPLHTTLPPLIFGTGTFNTQYNQDPYTLQTVSLVRNALDSGIRAFDTSPYYGPAELLLGDALHQPSTWAAYPRESYHLLTKVGRISSDEFDYSASWVRQSIQRSCERLGTNYLDVVYCHDVEYVSAEEMLEAIAELRRLRDEDGRIKYIGISAYPVDLLVQRAELVKDQTGEPLDMVLSYANYTLQNTRLATEALQRLKNAGVDVVANASVLGLGLIRRDGFASGADGDWHPASRELREAISHASDFCDEIGERIEDVAIRFALESWMHKGAIAGACGSCTSGIPEKTADQLGQTNGYTGDHSESRRLGVSVIGVSNKQELAKSLSLWRSALDALPDGAETAKAAGRWHRHHEWSVLRRDEVKLISERVREILAGSADVTWDSPPADYVNRRSQAAPTS